MGYGHEGPIRQLRHRGPDDSSSVSFHQFFQSGCSEGKKQQLMAREKSPGLKILWLWTIGTAAVMVTTVVKMRLRDMDQLMNAQQEEQLQRQHPGGDSLLLDADPIQSGNDDDNF